MTSWEIFDKVLNEANVVITPGSGFGGAGEGYFRILGVQQPGEGGEAAKRFGEEGGMSHLNMSW